MTINLTCFFLLQITRAVMTLNMARTQHNVKQIHEIKLKPVSYRTDTHAPGVI